MDIAYKSHVGKVRTSNQDSYMVFKLDDLKLLILAVADGLGGHNGGEVASNMLIDNLKESLEKEDLIKSDEIQIDSVISIIKEANRVIFEAGNKDPKLNKMGTTLTLTIVRNDSLYIFHVGDSRAYLVNNKDILQLTKDHSLVEQLVMQGEISPEEAQTHPKKNILVRAIGTEEDVEVDLYRHKIKDDEKLLLCTDGLTNLLHPDEIKRIIVNNDCKSAVDALIEKANEYGGYDNVTAIVYEPEVSI